MARNISIVDSSEYKVIFEDSSDSDEYINIMYDSMDERELAKGQVSNDNKLGNITSVVDNKNLSIARQRDHEKNKLDKLKTRDKENKKMLAEEKIEKKEKERKAEKKNKEEVIKAEKIYIKEDGQAEKMRKDKEIKKQTQENEDGHYKEQLKVNQKVFAYAKLAPTVRTEFDSIRKTYLENVLLNPKFEIDLNLLHYKGTRGRMCGATFPLNMNCSVKVTDEYGAVLTSKDVKTIVREVRRRTRSKLLQFCENRRPAYWGTWSKTSDSVGPRRPFGKENILDYNVDSDDEWENGVEPGESSTDSEGEGEEKESANNHYKIDYEFTVPDGYLSEEEIPKEDNEPVLLPSVVTETQYKCVLDVKPSVIGCCWSEDLNLNPHAEVLRRYAAVVLSSTTPIKLIDDDTVRKRKTFKRLVSEESIPALIRLLHGSACSKLKIVKDFLLYLERNLTEKGEKVPSQTQILAKIAQIASLNKSTEVGTSNGKMCYFVHAEVLARYNLANLSPIGRQYSGNVGIRHRDENVKKQSRQTDEDTDTPPAKTPRVSHQ